MFTATPSSTNPVPDGDQDEDKTYSGVGRVLSQWEEIEQILGNLYSGFIGRLELVDAMREYGIKPVFSARLSALRAESSTYFRSAPNQALEGEFDKIATQTTSFSVFRNNIAHGIVRPICSLDPARPSGDPLWRFYLLPPNYRKKSFGSFHLPTYVYDSKSMVKLASELYLFSQDLLKFRFQLWNRSHIYILTKGQP